MTTVVALVAVAVVAAATGFVAGLLFRSPFLGGLVALVEAIEAEPRRRRTVGYRHRPVERLRPGAMADEDPPTERELRVRREELLAHKLAAGQAIHAERASFAP